MSKLDELKERLELSKSQTVLPVPRVTAALTAQTEVIQALVEVVEEQNRKLRAMGDFLDSLGVDASAAAPKPPERFYPAPVETLEGPAGLAQPVDLAPPPPPRAPASSPGVEFRNTARIASDLGAPSFSTPNRVDAPMGQHQRQSGQHESVVEGVTPSGDLNQHGGYVSTGPAHPPTQPPPPQRIDVSGPGSPGGGPTVSFRPAPVDPGVSPGEPREPIVELKPAEPPELTDGATVEFSPAAPPVEATPAKPEELTNRGGTP